WGAVRGDHDLARALVERVEGVGELLLRAALLGQELDVVDDQRLNAAELPPEALHAPRLERGDHLVHEVLRGEAHHRAERARVGEAGRHRREQVGLAEPAAAAEEERVEAGTGLRHHRTCRPVSDAVRLPDDEVVEGVARGRAVRGALGAAGRERAGARRHAQLPIDQQQDRGPPAARLAHRALDRGEEVLPQPVTRNAARRLERERVGGPAGRTQGRDPRVVVLVEQLAAQPAPRLDPYGVQHPRPHFEPDPRRASEDPPRNAPQAGEKSPNSPTRALTRLRPPPETPHRPTAASSCARRPRPTTLHLIASFESESTKKVELILPPVTDW